MALATTRQAQSPCRQDVMVQHYFTKIASKQGGTFHVDHIIHSDPISDRHSPTFYSCSAYKIFPTEGSDAEEAILKYGCLVNWGADSIYRSLPARFASSTAAPEVTATASISATTGRSLLSFGFSTHLVTKCLTYPISQIPVPTTPQQALAPARPPIQLRTATAHLVARTVGYQAGKLLE